MLSLPRNEDHEKGHFRPSRENNTVDTSFFRSPAASPEASQIREAMTGATEGNSRSRENGGILLESFSHDGDTEEGRLALAARLLDNCEITAAEQRKILAAVVDGGGATDRQALIDDCGSEEAFYSRQRDLNRSLKHYRLRVSKKQGDPSLRLIPVEKDQQMDI